jgi:CHAT domain-containing protein
VQMRQFISDEATEANIKAVNNPQVLHIATHGYFLSDVSLASDNSHGLGNMDARTIMENPLLRSGLLFAGAKQAFVKDQQAATDAEDGVLTAYEAMNLDLENTDLVVMSACETGLGVTTNGEGVYGLQRAFQVAGAKSVLMSLWTVSDEATKQLMIAFYENWLAGKTPHEAFRLSQLTIRQTFPEPFYWGAFVMVGR